MFYQEYGAGNFAQRYPQEDLARTKVISEDVTSLIGSIRSWTIKEIHALKDAGRSLRVIFTDQNSAAIMPVSLSTWALTVARDVERNA